MADPTTVQLAADGDLAVAKLDDDQRLIFGWAYVARSADGEMVWDHSGEAVEKAEELEATAYDFVLASRVGGADHRGDAPNTMVESIVFTPDKVAKMGLPDGVLPTGWWVGFHVADDELWALVKSGARPAFSIEGTAVREPVDVGKAVQGSQEEERELLQAAVQAAVGGGYVWLRAVMDGSVVYEHSKDDDQPSRTWQRTYTWQADGTVALGPPTQVRITEHVEPVTTPEVMA